MKFFGILFVFVVLVAAEVTAQGPETNKTKVLTTRISYKCETDQECPKDYGCKCDEFLKVCIYCKECKDDEHCREKYNNADSGCICSALLCVGCIEAAKN